VIGLILRIAAFLLFLLAAVNQTLFQQPPADLVAFGLAAWVLAVLLDGVGPAAPAYRRAE
jgi:hypothetical protein